MAGGDNDARAMDWLVGGGEMGQLVRATNWSATRLGPVESWPRSLKTMLGVMLGSRFPMLVWWGPDLLHLYNDAYRPILRDKHPASLGAPAAEVWQEVWEVAGPMAQSVLDGGPATWTEDLQLFIANEGIAEETYFTFSYSPVPGDDGRVGGVLNTVQETTVKVQSERQVRMLHDLAARATEAKSTDSAYRIAMEVLSTNELDVPFALLYVVNETADAATLAGASGWSDYDGPANAVRMAFGEGSGLGTWPIEAIAKGTPEVIIDDLAARFGVLPLGRWNGRPEQAIALPLSRAGQTAPYAILVLGLSPHRTYDERYRRFFRATADQIMGLVASARAYEEERGRAEALAEIDRAKTAFFSNVSHEFRTPLTLMIGPLEDELSEHDGPLPPARRERIEAAHRNGVRLLKLVNTLLDFSRLEAGRVQASYEAVDLATLTAELASNFRSAIERGGLTLTVNCLPLAEPIYVDREMWEKIVLNLLSNAFKHTFQGGIVVRLSAVSDGVELIVQDSGVGIAADEIPRLFNRFHRVKGAASRTHEGTGIGLSLVRELVQLHDGRIRVESEPGMGSHFIVTLKTGSAHLPADKIDHHTGVTPTGRGVAAYVQEAAQWLSAGVAGEYRDGPDVDVSLARSEVAGPRARILWADDNADMRHYVARLLGRAYDVIAVPDGQAALEAVRAGETLPDLVLSDVMMPRLDGFGLLKALRDDERTRRLPVILLSARAGEDAAIEGLDVGADDYLVKPFSARELLARVRTHLGLAKERRAWESELERRVRERTAELASANDQLHDQAIQLEEQALELEQQIDETQTVAHALEIANVDLRGALTVAEQSRSAAQIANRAKSEFLAVMSHELRTPLNAIIGYGELLRAEICGPLTEDQQDKLGRMARSAGSLLGLIGQVLDFERVIAGRAEIFCEPVDVGLCLREVAAEVEAQAARKGLTLVIDPLPVPLVLETDPTKLQQILLNLLSNAVKYTPHGEIRVSARSVDSGTAISVRDTGIGIAPEDRAHIFTPFWQGNQRFTRTAGGTGLGLAIVHQFTQLLGGEVTVDSVSGQGSTFTISLPASPPRADDLPAVAAGSERMSLSA